MGRYASVIWKIWPYKGVYGKTIGYGNPALIHGLRREMYLVFLLNHFGFAMRPRRSVEASVKKAQSKSKNTISKSGQRIK